MSIPDVAIEERVAALLHREAAGHAGNALRHLLHGGVVEIRHPVRRRVRVPEEQRLVGEVLVDARVPIEVVRRQVRQHAGARVDARRVVQLERRHLERDPRRRRRRQRELGERRADVARRRREPAEALQEMADERGRGGLAVRSGDGDVGELGQKAQPDLDLAHDVDARVPRRNERRRVGRNTRARDDERRARDALEVVTAEVHGDVVRPQLGGGRLELRRRAEVRRVDPLAGASQQARGRSAAPRQAHDRDLSLQPFWLHRQFRKARHASTKLESAQRKERAQNPNDPESHDDLGLLPPQLLEVVVQRRSTKDAGASRAYGRPYRLSRYLNTDR